MVAFPAAEVAEVWLECSGKPEPTGQTAPLRPVSGRPTPVVDPPTPEGLPIPVGLPIPLGLPIPEGLPIPISQPILAVPAEAAE